ncbi:MAG: DEAD/DEAH box helicase [Fibrobacter sp.]|nr:DEAD/DEAH box helicase [Fibrobacter sp.]
MDQEITFEELGLAPEILDAVKAAGYETPSPIQAKAIPALLQGKNLLGTAQTGTGKTAAFALPLLSRIEFNAKETSLLVLTPTRELSIQVAEAIQQYAMKLPKVHVVPVYGGQDISVQFKALKRSANVIVATPGRLIDHLKRGSITLDKVQAVVLDEADEMLDMGFMEDVETILSEIPENAQRALFSATMPKEVLEIIDEHLGEYSEARIEGKTTTVENIRQRFLLVKNHDKMEALARVIEGEDFDGMLIFVRTKQATSEVSERLEARGFNVAPLSGDLAQTLRERTINRLKMGKLDIVVATDVAARGIDVDRITHVVNYDIPYDTESYVHRIGRTGRAGRSGNAILFITPRERRLLKTIEKATRQPIEAMSLPSAEQISAKRIANFQKKIQDKLTNADLSKFREIFMKMTVELGSDIEEVAAAALCLAQEREPIFPKMEQLSTPKIREQGDKDNSGERKERKEGANGVEEGYLRYYLAVGRRDHVSPRDIVGAIAGEADISSAIIGRIKLFDKFSTVELPENTDQGILDILSEMTIRGNDAKFRLMTDDAPPPKDRGFKGKKKFSKEKKPWSKEKPFREAHGDKPFRKTRRFGRH